MRRGEGRVAVIPCDVFLDHAHNASRQSDEDTNDASCYAKNGNTFAVKGLLDLVHEPLLNNLSSSSSSSSSSPVITSFSSSSSLTPAFHSILGVDIIVSNPPYIPFDDLVTLNPSVREWEDPGALAPIHCNNNNEEDNDDDNDVNNVNNSDNKIGKGSHSDTSHARWPSKQEISRLALPFYERILRQAPLLLRPLQSSFFAEDRASIQCAIDMQGEARAADDITSAAAAAATVNATATATVTPPSTTSLSYTPDTVAPRIVFEIGSREQVAPIANMMRLVSLQPRLEPVVYLDLMQRPRMMVGFQRYGK